ncbi:unnamed protein product [Darwinula stevensoni]|uniref:Uncharacterized protein n=1 Tax=Darwinula stevensoni TaxID=69355 RepID=A0A7R9AAU8_9CRUS|nr:unnamed protein product [Darwinula stevensoni]CAG0898782.1 unnamed protein product [Darwinula stevensoni]
MKPVNIQWDPPGLHRMILTGLGDERTEESEDMNHTESNVAAWMLGTLMVVLVSLSIFFIYRKRQRREEVARGGRGAKRAKVPEEGWDDEDGEHAIYTGPPPDLKKPQLDHPFKKSQYSPLPREPPQLTDETSLNGGDSEKPSVTGKGSQSELEWDNQELNAPVSHHSLVRAVILSPAPPHSEFPMRIARTPQGNLVTRDEDSEDDEVFEGDNRGTLRMDEMQSRRQFED